jgi:hypothetical protein
MTILTSTIVSDAVLRAGVWLTQGTTPSPSPTFGSYTGDEDLITPGWVGFAITFLIAVATVLLVLDMTRRVRRTRYRGEIREKLEAEAAEGEADRRPE